MPEPEKISIGSKITKETLERLDQYHRLTGVSKTRIIEEGINFAIDRREGIQEKIMIDSKINKIEEYMNGKNRKT